MEIDFLLQKDKVTSRHNIRPIEVKSGKNYTLSSLTKCMKRFGENMTTPTILHVADLKVEGEVTYLPLYMTPLLWSAKHPTKQPNHATRGGHYDSFVICDLWKDRRQPRAFSFHGKQPCSRFQLLRVRPDCLLAILRLFTNHKSQNSKPPSLRGGFEVLRFYTSNHGTE